MNGKRISFNRDGEAEYLFIAKDFRLWYVLEFWPVDIHVKRLHAMTTGAM